MIFPSAEDICFVDRRRTSEPHVQCTHHTEKDQTPQKTRKRRQDAFPFGRGLALSHPSTQRRRFKFV
jgi:hypothetical protein